MVPTLRAYFTCNPLLVRTKKNVENLSCKQPKTCSRCQRQNCLNPNHICLCGCAGERKRIETDTPLMNNGNWDCNYSLGSNRCYVKPSVVYIRVTILPSQMLGIFLCVSITSDRNAISGIHNKEWDQKSRHAPLSVVNLCTAVN